MAVDAMHLPLIDPRPPRLSEHPDALRRLEASGQFSNNGPELTAFEREATEQLFGGRGATLGVVNATLGLMLALRDATRHRRAGRGSGGGYAIMPAFTFAATAQAAWWAGLTPLVIDVDPDDWGACAHAEAAMLHRHGDAVAALLPYAAFGRAIDLDRYAALAARYDVGVVIDAAASLGTRDEAGTQFGAGSPFPVVYSMHATKPFAVAEGGLVHCDDADTIARLRAMAGFGFEGQRSATLPGLNAKLPELIALAARLKLAGFAQDCARRDAVVAAYRDALGGRYALQSCAGGTQAHAFLPLLLPPSHATERARIVADLAASGVGAGTYFSPHLGQQPWMRAEAVIAATPVADDLAARVLCLPVSDRMTPEDAHAAVAALDRVVAPRRVVATRAGERHYDTVLIGGGPAGTAMLTAASRHSRLRDLARGLLVVEAGDALGAGKLGGYAIRSDSSADTFLSALADNPHPEIAALADHPSARGIARCRDQLGVPLGTVGPLLDTLGDRLAGLVRAHGGEVATNTTAQRARRTADGGWAVRLRSRDGGEREVRARNLVVATGGQQRLDEVVAAEIGGVPLHRLADARLMLSDAVLTTGGTAAVEDLLRAHRAPRIAVVGGSTSAVTSVVALLKSALPLGAGAITLLHRRPLRPFYPSVDAARADGFNDFGDADICPVSGFVYRLAGFRLEARELVLRQLGIGGRAPDPRVALHRIGDDPAHARALVEQADLVVAALGYRPRALPLEDAAGAPVALASDGGGAMVDAHCRLRAAGGGTVAGAYGIGLAAGFLPSGRLGGEASFRGQANGLWLWQNDVGLMIVDQLLGQQSVQNMEQAA